MIDISDWNMKDLADLESLSGQSFSSIEDEDKPKARVLTAMAFIHLRRTDPKLKYGAVERMGFAEIQEIIGINEEDDDEASDNDDADLESDDPKAPPTFEPEISPSS